MADEATSSKLRRGTKSCTECRRRKVRCVWTSEQAPECRRCEERGTVCIPQTQSIPAPGARKLSSKERISRLEGHVNHLSKAVRDLESKLGQKVSATPEFQTVTKSLGQAENSPGFDEDEDDDDEDEDDDASSVAQMVTEDRPSHLYSLFQNEMLSTDNSSTLRQKGSKSRNQLLDQVKSALSPLIPPKDDVYTLANHISRWYGIMFDIFPLSRTQRTTEDILEGYRAALEPEVDPMVLANFMLILAMISQQVPQDAYSPSSAVKGLETRTNFARQVSDAIQTTIISHYSLLGSLAGLEIAMLWLRVQMNWGHLHKTWLCLRKVIAVSELIGLPRAARQALMRDVNKGTKVAFQDPKAAIWVSICTVDRVASILHNFPTATQRYVGTMDETLIIDGAVHPPAFLLRLSKFAIRIQELDELNFSSQSGIDVYAAVLKLDSEWRHLESEVPSHWWKPEAQIGTGTLLQFWYHCIGMRMHLPLMLRKDPKNEYSYSRHAGLQACHRVAELWETLRRDLPSGFFFCRVIDLQAFTAGVVLMLSGERAQRAHGVWTNAEVANMQRGVERVLALMEEKIKDPIGSDIAREAATGMRSLAALLAGDVSGGIQLTVPLLGTVHLRRNTPTQSAPQQEQPTNPAWQPQTQLAPTIPTENKFYNFPMAHESLMANGLGQQDPFSWFIEDDHENMFQNNLMAEDIGTFGNTSFPVPMDFTYMG